MYPLKLIFMVLALLCFFMAALNVQTPRGNLLAAGLFCWALATALSK